MISIRIYTPIFSFYFPFTLDWCLEKKTKTHSPNLAWNPPGGPGGGPPAGTPPGGPWKGLGSCGGGCLSRAHRRRRGGGHGLSRLGLWFFHRHFLTTFSHYKEFSKSFEGMNALFFWAFGTYTPPKNCRITTDQRTRRSLGFFLGGALQSILQLELSKLFFLRIDSWLNTQTIGTWIPTWWHMVVNEIRNIWSSLRVYIYIPWKSNTKFFYVDLWTTTFYRVYFHGIYI